MLLGSLFLGCFGGDPEIGTTLDQSEIRVMGHGGSGFVSADNFYPANSRISILQAVDILGPLKPQLAKELGLRSDVQVIVGTPDIQSAAIGSGAVQDYEAHLYLGTSSWIVCHIPFKKTDVFHGRVSVGLSQNPNTEWFAGYDHVEIGDLAIQGVVAGIRFRF